MDTVDLVLIFLLVLMALGFLWVELRVNALKTRVVKTPQGLRFEARGFSVEVLRADEKVVVRHKAGQRTAAPAGEPTTATAPAPAAATAAAPASAPPSTPGAPETVFDAKGLRFELGPLPPGVKPVSGRVPAHASEVLFRAANGSGLRLVRIPRPVLLSFESFAVQIRYWIGKLEQQAERARVERLRQEQEAAQAEEHARMLADMLAAKKSDEPLTETDVQAIAAAQIAKWRTAAGFEGQHTEYRSDANGQVLWFIDVAADGRITLHANKRSISTTLRGASIASMGGELEIGVRDDYWSEDDPELRVFKVLKGLGADERRAWKERLILIRDGMPAKPAASAA